MKREGLLKRNLAVLLTAVMALGIVSLGPNDVTKVRAEETKSKSTIMLGTSGIANPSEPTKEGWSGSYVYFGKYNGNAVKYRVLDNETTVFDGKTMLLDCDSILWSGDENSKFNKNADDVSANDWSVSDIKTYLNGENFLKNTNNFSEVEQAAIAASTKKEAYKGDSDNGKDGAGWEYLEWAPLNGEKIFLLDAKEATNTSYGYSNTYNSATNRVKNALSGSAAYWWLRSPDADYDDRAGGVYSGGDILYIGVSSGDVGVSPALNINLSSVLFSSEIPNNNGKKEYKLTIIDNGLKIAITESKSVSRTVDDRTGDIIITVPYTISENCVNDVTQVSVLITDKKYTDEGVTKKEYVALNLNGSAIGTSGEGTFKLPSELSEKVCGSDYHVYIIAEDVNDTYETDYASAPVEITFSKDEPAKTDTDNSNNSSSNTDTGSTSTSTETTVEAAPITITYTVKKDDYMRKIAREHGITLEQLIALNPQVKNPNLIYAGQVLVISTTGTITATTEITATKTYSVQRGDSLYKIARKNGMTLAELKFLNENLFAQKYIYAGQQVLLK